MTLNIQERHCFIRIYFKKCNPFKILYVQPVNLNELLFFLNHVYLAKGDAMQTLISKIEPLELKRKSLFKKYLLNLLIASLLTLLIIALFVLTLKQGLYFVLFLLLVPIFFVLKALGIANEFKNTIKDELIQLALKDKFEDVTYDRHGSISQAVIDHTGLVKTPDRYSGEDLIKGSYKGVTFEVSDVTLRERHEHVDSKGNRTVSYPVYFKGRWYVYSFPKNFKGTLKVSEGNPNEARGLEKVETESIAFNKKFKMYASDKQYAFYHLTPSMMENLLTLEKEHKGRIYFYYERNELHIGVNDSQDYLEIPFSRKINEQSMLAFDRDVALIPKIIDELKLTSTKFKN